LGAHDVPGHDRFALIFFSPRETPDAPAPRQRLRIDEAGTLSNHAAFRPKNARKPHEQR
jgi:hypothetical protein